MMKEQKHQHQQQPTPTVLMGDIEIESQNQKNEQESLESALLSIGDALGHASDLLDGLENENSLAPAIRRYAADLALVVGNVARDLIELEDVEKNDSHIDNSNGNDSDSDNDKRRKWARALLEDAQSQLALEVEQQGHSTMYSNSNPTSQAVANRPNPVQKPKSAAGAITTLQEKDIIHAFSAARHILLDIEEVLLDISRNQEDAEEIADVGLVVAKMFLWGLQNVQNQVVRTVLDNDNDSGSGGGNCNKANKRQEDYSMRIEILDADENVDHTDDHNGDETDDRKKQSNRQRRKRALDERRMRVLWPPIGPAVLNVASWGKEEAMHHPILSIALAMALWPMAIIVAFVGAPILAVDYALQSSYDALSKENGGSSSDSDSYSEPNPILRNVEIGAANLCHVGKFYYLVSKMMLKQGIRLTKRKIQRKGGLEKVVGDVGNWTVERALHPMESIGMAWNTVVGGTSAIIGAAAFVKDVAAGKVELEHGAHLNLHL